MSACWLACAIIALHLELCKPRWFRQTTMPPSPLAYFRILSTYMPVVNMMCDEFNRVLISLFGLPKISKYAARLFDVIRFNV